jgi:hypothetical protein
MITVTLPPSRVWSERPDVLCALAMQGRPSQRMTGWSCSVHGVDGFVVHRAETPHQWRVSHIATGRGCPESLADSREAAIRAAERVIAAEARRKGYSRDVERFLRACIWEETNSLLRYEAAVEAEGVRS